jgi:hypothetical protein
MTISQAAVVNGEPLRLNRSDRYLRAVRQYADTVLLRGVTYTDGNTRLSS